MRQLTKYMPIWQILVLMMVIILSACKAGVSDKIDAGSPGTSVINDSSNRVDQSPALMVSNIELIRNTFWDEVQEEAFEYAVITAYSDIGKAVWSYETPKCVETEMAAVVELGQKEACYYFAEDSSVVCLDVQTGMVLWRNDDYTGRVSGYAFGKDAIYLCGQYGPDFYAISYTGQTLSLIQQFDERYCWASEIELLEGKAAVYLHGETEDYDIPQIFYVDLNTYEVSVGPSSDEHAQAIKAEYSSYQDVLDTLYQGISNHWADYDYYQTDVSDELNISYLWYMDSNISLSNAGYALIDLNDDGISELLVGKNVEGALGAEEGMFLDLYTSQNGKIIRLASSGERDRYYLCKDYVIANEGSDGSNNSAYSFYTMGQSVAGLNLKEIVLYDDLENADNPWFYGTVATTITSQLKSIGADKAQEIINSYEHLPIDWNLFNQYVPESNI